MSNENSNHESDNEEQIPMIMSNGEDVPEEETGEFQVVQCDPKPVFMHRGGKPVEVGHAIVTRREYQTDIQIVLDTEDGNEFGSMVVTPIMIGMSIGGIMDPDIAAAIKAQQS